MLNVDVIAKYPWAFKFSSASRRHRIPSHRSICTPELFISTGNIHGYQQEYGAPVRLPVDFTGEQVAALAYKSIRVLRPTRSIGYFVLPFTRQLLSLFRRTQFGSLPR